MLTLIENCWPYILLGAVLQYLWSAIAIRLGKKRYFISYKVYFAIDQRWVFGNCILTVNYNVFDSDGASQLLLDIFEKIRASEDGKREPSDLVILHMERERL